MCHSIIEVIDFPKKKKKKDQRGVTKKKEEIKILILSFISEEKEISRVMKRKKMDVSSNMFAHCGTRGQKNKLMKENERNETTLIPSI